MGTPFNNLGFNPTVQNQAGKIKPPAVKKNASNKARTSYLGMDGFYSGDVLQTNNSNLKKLKPQEKAFVEKLGRDIKDRAHAELMQSSENYLASPSGNDDIVNQAQEELANVIASSKNMDPKAVQGAIQSIVKRAATKASDRNQERLEGEDKSKKTKESVEDMRKANAVTLSRSEISAEEQESISRLDSKHEDANKTETEDIVKEFF